MAQSLSSADQTGQRAKNTTNIKASRSAGSTGRPFGSAGSRSQGVKKSGSAGSVRERLGSGQSDTSDTPRASKPSDRLNPKTVDPFSGCKSVKSAFAMVYNSGGVPCRLVHGSVKHKLAWDMEPCDVPFDPVLVTLAEGLRETVHPYTFVASNGFQQLLELPDAGSKVAPLLAKIVSAIRAALGNSEMVAFDAGLLALDQLSSVSGPALNSHLKTLMVPISKRMMDKKCKDRATDCLHHLEENGGVEAKRVIKSKIPTYNSVIS